MNSGKDIQQLHLDINALSLNLALSNYLLCRAIVAEPQLGVQPLVLQSLSLQKSLMMTLQNSLSNLEPIQKGYETLESFIQKLQGPAEAQIQWEKLQNKLEEHSDNIEPPQSTPSYETKRIGFKKKTESSSPDHLCARIQEILDFFIENKGLIAESDFEQKKSVLKTDPLLIQLFDCLNARYNSTFKTKEEMTKYIVRKSFRSIKQRISKLEGVSKKNASKTLIQKFFSEDLVAQIRKQLPDNASDDQILEYLFPFKKNSKNKTINSSFVSQLFASKEFLTEYDIFMEKFDAFTKADNKKKCQKFVDFLLDCYENRKFELIRNYKRVPWVLAWIKKTKGIALELPFQTAFSNKNYQKEVPADRNYEEELHPVQKKVDKTYNKKNSFDCSSESSV